MDYCLSFSSDSLPGLVSGPATPTSNPAEYFVNDASSGSMMSSWGNSFYIDDGSVCSTPSSHDTEMGYSIWDDLLPSNEGFCDGGLMVPDPWDDFLVVNAEPVNETWLSAEIHDSSHIHHHHHQVMEDHPPPATQFSSLYQTYKNAPKNSKQNSNDCDDCGAQTVCIHVCSNDPAIHDGYVWRKYGQKDIKGRRFPRSYFKCAQPGCSIKKQSEASSDNEGIMVITYIGRHNHNH